MRYFTLILLSFLYVLPAFAAPVIDQAGADALKPKLEAALKHYETQLKNQGYALKQTGALVVEPAGSYYAITTPTLNITYANGITRNIGMIAINAIPTDTPDILKMAVAIPTPMTETNAVGKQTGIFTIGTQAMNGLWHLNAKTFVQLKGAYKNITYKNDTDASALSIPDLSIDMNLKDMGQNLWSGPTQIMASGIEYKQPKKGYKVGELRSKSNVEKLDITAHTKSEADFLAGLSNSTDTNISLSHVYISSEDKNNKKQDVTIKNITLTGTLKDAPQGQVNATWQALADGISTNDAQAVSFMPTSLQFKGQATNLPLKELLLAKDPVQQKAIMNKSNMGMKLERAVINAPKYGLDATGAFQKAENGTTAGRMNISLRGIPELITWINGPDSPRMNGQSLVPPAVVGVLTMVQMTGKQSTDAQGRSVLTYDLKLTPDGKMMLNGADLSALTGALVKPAKK